MVIVNIEDFFIPDAGYQINILSKYFVGFGHKVYIVTAEIDGFKDGVSSFFGTDNIRERDAEFTRRTGVEVIRVKPLVNKFVSGRIIFGKKLFKTVDSLKPDVVFVHGNDTLTGIQYIMKRNKGYGLVTDSHMLKMASTNKFSVYFQKFYRTVVTPQIIKKKIPVIRTQNDDYVQSGLGIPLEMAPWISYGTDIALFHPDEDVKKAFREEYGISQDDFVFVFTGKLIESKGGKLLAEAFLKKFNTSKGITLIVVGSSSDQYSKEVEAIFEKAENRIVRFPTQKYFDLAKFYQAADACVFAKQCSLSFYDAQACGLPIISENNNINLDRNSHGNGFCFIEGNVDDFRAKIQKMVELPTEEYEKMKESSIKFIIENYSYEKKAMEYMDVLVEQYNRYCKTR